MVVGHFFSFGDEFSPSYDCNLKLKNWSKMLECFLPKNYKKLITFLLFRDNFKKICPQ
jgi:hypothetical protein